MAIPKVRSRSGSGARQAHGISVVNVVQPRPKVYLKLLFEDPAAVVRALPQGLPVTVAFGDPAQVATFHTIDVHLGPGGVVSFLAQPDPVKAWESFTLRFQSGPAGSPPAPGRHYIFCPTGSPPPPSVLETRPADEAVTDARPFFTLPPQWEMKHAIWRVGPAGMGANGNFDAARGTITHTRQPDIDDIGSAVHPVELILVPKWIHARFVFFDRYYGHSHHGDRRISIPAVSLEGFRGDPAAAGTPDVRSNWTVGADPARLVQCLPWIVLRADDGAPLPDLSGANLGLRLRTHAVQRSVVHSQSDTVRQIRDINPGAPLDAALLQPGPERLRYYDLPRVWKSKKYYTRPGNAGAAAFAAKFFETLTAPDVASAESSAAPLVFCLDDMVLYAAPALASPPGEPVPLPALGASDKVAIFNHRFDGTLPNSTAQGLYRSLAAGAAAGPLDLPCSQVLSDRNYLHDYPDWARLVIAQGNLFDVFDRRTPDDPHPDRVVGARAAVRWLDGTDSFPGVATDSIVGGLWTPQADGRPLPGRRLLADPPLSREPPGAPAFWLQPFRRQHYAVRYREPYNPLRQEETGRFDLALLRCCDVDAAALGGAEEVAVALHYVKTFYDFTSASPPAPLTVTQQVYAHDASENISNRWSGNDPGVSVHRAELLPWVPSPPPSPPVVVPRLRVSIVTFCQSVPEARAHIKADIEGGGRDNRLTLNGTGKSGSENYRTGMQGAMAVWVADHWFPSAHETGHVMALPDEYNERWNGASYNQISFKANLPGDPYEPDGRDESGDQADTGMMNGNRLMRNRYFWPTAEWVRARVGARLRVKLGPYTDYHLPTHPQDGRTYYGWPIQGLVDIVHPTAPPLSPPAPPDFYRLSLFLYALGRDRWSVDLLPNGPVDGVLVIALRMACYLPENLNPVIENSIRVQALQQMAAGVRLNLANQWYARGNAVIGSPPQPCTLNRCLLHFVPQFVVFNHPNEVQPSPPDWSNPSRQMISGSVLGAFNYNFVVRVFDAATLSPPNATVRFDLASRAAELYVNSFADLPAQFAHVFRLFLGLPGMGGPITGPDLEPIVRQAIPGAAVFPLP